MYRGQRKIFIDDLHLIAIGLQDVRKKRLMHSGTEWALKVVVIYDHDLGLFVSTPGTAAQVDHLRWIGVEVHLLPTH